MQKRAIFLAAVLLLVSLTPVLAQDGNWFAYLYNGMSKDLVRVNASGTSSSTNLGLDENTFISSYDMTFSADGSRVAYCAVTYPPGSADAPGQPTAKLYLRDLTSGANLVEVDFGSAIGCRTGRNAFNESETLLAVGKVNYFPGDPSVTSAGPLWQLLIVEAASGSTVQELNNESQPVADFDTLGTTPVIPYVQDFTGSQVTFAEVPYGVGGGAEWNAYQWQTDTGTLTPVPRWGNLGLDQLDATGEMIWVGVDPNLPSVAPAGPIPAYNVVKTADASGEERTIFHSPNETIANARFINGGQQIAILLLPQQDPNATTPPPSRWVALDRSGSVADLQTIEVYSDVVAAPGGYALFMLDYQGENFTNPLFSLQWFNNGQPTQLWSDMPQDPSISWELAWGAPVPAAPNLSPFPTVSG